MRSRALILALAVAGTTLATGAGHAATTATAVAGVPAECIGEHGPVANLADARCTANGFVDGPIEVVGHTALAQPNQFGQGTAPLGNNGGIALLGDCLFVGRWHDYGDTTSTTLGAGPRIQYPVQIVDVSDPATPSVIGTVPDSTIHDAVAREIRAIDLPPSSRFPLGFKMLTVQTFGKYTDEHAIVPGQDALYYYVFPSGDCSKPVPAGHFYPPRNLSYGANPLRPHEFFQWIDPNPAHDATGTIHDPNDPTKFITAHVAPRVVDLVTTPLGGLDGFIVNVANPASPTLLGTWTGAQPEASVAESNLVGGVPAGAGRYTHSITLSPDGRTAFLSQWDGGFVTLDSSQIADPTIDASPAGRVNRPAVTLLPLGAQSVPLFPATAPGNAHSAVAIAGDARHVIGGDEVYVTTDGCPFGWLHIFDQGDQSTPPSEISQYGLAENNPANCSGVQVKDRNADGLRIDGTFTMHNQTVTDRYVFTSWYGGGLRIVNVSDVAHPVEAAAFVPSPSACPPGSDSAVDCTLSLPDTTAPIYGATKAALADPNTPNATLPPTADDWRVSMWSYPIVRDGLIFVCDVRDGVYILRAKSGSDLANDTAGKYFEGNSNLGDFLGPVG